MRKYLSLLLALIMIASLVPFTLHTAEADSSGKCGDNLTWTFKASTGTLTITGSGAMYDFDYDDAPWKSYKDSIVLVDMNDSVTSIGNYAFYQCGELETVNISNSLERIGRYAFSFCSSLYSIEFPDSIQRLEDFAFSSCTELSLITIGCNTKKIGDYCFTGCTNVNSVILGSSLETVGEHSFYGCEELTCIIIPNHTMKIGGSAFANCSSICDIWFLGQQSDRYDNLTIESGNVYFGFASWTYYTISSVSMRTLPKKTVYEYGDDLDLNGTTLSAKYGSSITISVAVTEDMVSGYNSVKAGKQTVVASYEGKTASFNVTVLEDPSQTQTPSPNAPNITKQPTNKTVALGNTAAFSVTASGENLQYQWQYSKNNGSTWTNWSGKTSAALSFKGSETNNGYLYRCIIKNSYGSVTSNSAKLTVSGVKPKITSQPAAKTVATGKATTFKVVAAGSGLSYQWQYSKNNGSTWTSWSGKTSATLSLKGSETNNGYLYRCKVTNSYGSVTSSSAKLTVSDVKPKITSQPAAKTVASGKAATFKVVAAGSGLSYQWQYSKNNGSTWTSWSGKTSATLSVTGSETNNGYLYRCVVKNSYGSVTSGSVRLTVSNVKPKILTQPAAQTAASGNTVTFKVVAGGSGLSYQWQYSKNNGSTWTSWSGKTSATLSFKGSETNNGYLYRCEVTNSYGSVTSNSAKLTVSDVKPKITEQPANQAVASGKSVTFKVVAAGSGLSYQWQYSKNSGSTWTDWSGKTASSFSVTASDKNNGCMYRCKVSNAYGTVYSAAGTLLIMVSDYRALLIGQNDYTDSPLYGCINDMNALAGMLQGLSDGFAVTKLQNASRSQIMNGIKSAYSGATDDDVSVFTYAGHGLYAYGDELDQGALCTIDDDYITLEELATALSKVPGRVIVILDSCFSGSAVRNPRQNELDEFNQSVIDAFSGYRLESENDTNTRMGEFKKSKFVVITAAAYDESSWDGRYDGSGYSQGAFTAAFVQGMGCTYPNGAYSGGAMPADTNNNNQITLKEIYDYTYTTAYNWTYSTGTPEHVQYYGTDTEVLFRR